ncbi:MAG: AEC family transporter [bacterium]|jgi:predicted permease
MPANNSVAPLLIGFFIILGIGQWLRLSRKLEAVHSEILDLLVTDVTLPALAFYALAGQRIEKSVLGGVGIAWTVLLITLLLGFMMSRVLKLNRPSQGTMGICSSFSNTGFLGIPIVYMLYGSVPGTAGAAVIINAAASSLPLYTLAVALAIKYGGQGTFSGIDFLKGLFTPVTLALIIGVAFNLCKVVLPQWVLTPAQLLGGATVPLVVISLGLRLNFKGIRERLIPLLTATLIKQGVAPLIAIAIVVIFNMHGPVALAALVLSAMPTSMTSAIIASRYGCDGTMGSAIVVLTTACTGIILPIIVAVANYLHIIP